MGNLCNIVYDSDGKIEYVETPNGERSGLFDQLNTIFGEEKAVDLYALSQSEDFTGKQTVEDVVIFATSTEEPLTVQETADSMDMAVAFGATTSDELTVALSRAFIKDGVVVFDQKQLEKAGFNEYEINNLLNDATLQNTIRNTIFRLKNTEFTVESGNVETHTNDAIGIFGKQVPNVTIQEEAVFTVEDGQIISKKSDTKETLRKTYPINPAPISDKLKSLTNTITNVTENVAKNNPEKVKKVVEDIKREVVEYGIDLRGIEDRIYPVNRLKGLVGSLQNYLLNPNDSFADVYDSFFEIQMPEAVEENNEIKLDTELSEYELFRDHNLIRKSGNTYVYVAQENLNDLYNYFFRQQEQYKTKEEVQALIPQMEVEDFEADSDVLEAMVIWKEFLGYPLKTESNRKPSFIDIKPAVNNPYKKATSNGVVLKNNDSITKAKASLYEETIEEPLYKDQEQELREKILNNEVTIAKIATDYTVIEDGVLMTQNNTNQFVRTPLGTFELIYQDSNLSFYKEVVSTDKNLSNINFNNYAGEILAVDNYIKAKKHYTKQELEEINDKYFSCK